MHDKTEHVLSTAPITTSKLHSVPDTQFVACHMQQCAKLTPGSLFAVVPSFDPCTASCKNNGDAILGETLEDINNFSEPCFQW
jgi:hypothetical protein